MKDRRQLVDLVDKRREHDYCDCLGYHSRVSVKNRYIFIAIGKAASTRILLTLHQLEGHPELEPGTNIHDMGTRLGEFGTDEIVEMITSPEWFKFAFVRDPYDRLLSAYKTQVGNTWNEQTRNIKDAINRSLGDPTIQEDPERLISFRDFVHWLCDVGDRHLFWDGHMGVQCRMLMWDIMQYDFIGRVESLTDDLSTVLQRLGASPEILSTVGELVNRTHPLQPATAYDRDLAALVHGLYKEDFEHLGYDKDSWMYWRELSEEPR